jgi:osmotically inducible protein OsmC
LSSEATTRLDEPGAAAIIGNALGRTIMVARKADAEWQGDLRSGKGQVSLGSGAYTGPYSFRSRFESGDGTNPEELIGAAHAGCFSMALAAGLSAAGHAPERIRTAATVHIEQQDGGFAIPRIALRTEARVPGIDQAGFQEQAQAAKANCPLSKALAGTTIELEAKLL